MNVTMCYQSPHSTADSFSLSTPALRNWCWKSFWVKPAWGHLWGMLMSYILYPGASVPYTDWGRHVFPSPQNKLHSDDHQHVHIRELLLQVWNLLHGSLEKQASFRILDGIWPRQPILRQQEFEKASWKMNFRSSTAFLPAFLLTIWLSHNVNRSWGIRGGMMNIGKSSLNLQSTRTNDFRSSHSTCPKFSGSLLRGVLHLTIRNSSSSNSCQNGYPRLDRPLVCHIPLRSQNGRSLCSGMFGGVWKSLL